MEKNKEIRLFASLHVQYNTVVSMHWTNDHTVFIEKGAPGTKTGRKFFVTMILVSNMILIMESLQFTCLTA